MRDETRNKGQAGANRGDVQPGAAEGELTEIMRRLQAIAKAAEKGATTEVNTFGQRWWLSTSCRSAAAQICSAIEHIKP